MSRDEELRLINAAVADGRVTRIPMGVTSDTISEMRKLFDERRSSGRYQRNLKQRQSASVAARAVRIGLS